MFLKRIPDEARHRDCLALVRLMEQVTKAEPTMWGSSIVGFGRYHYVYPSGREGDMPLAGFSPRKQDLTIYNMGGLGQHGALLAKLGKHKASGSCLHIKRLEDVDLAVLKTLIAASVKRVKALHP